MVYGENKNFMTAIMTLKADADPKSGAPTKNLSPEAKGYLKGVLGLELNTTDEAISTEKVQMHIE